MKKRKREVSLVVFGTPIFLGDEENKDAMKIQSKYTPEHQQVVKDENGRRRFHGAFTGGFSAGYFNTVGSVEGFTPSSFVSSRKEGKKEIKSQRITDFMDEEDLKDINSNLQTNEEYSFQREEPKERSISDLIIPKKDSIGIRLLQKMNWKKGEGIGSKIKTQKKKYGVSLPDELEEDSFMEMSRVDVHVEVLKPKDNTYGMGFDPLENSGEIRKIKDNSMKISSGFNRDEEEEEEDIYSFEDEKSFQPSVQEEEEEEEVKKEILKTKEEGTMVCFDGKKPLQGFLLSSSFLKKTLKEEFNVIQVPNNFKPKPILSYEEMTDKVVSISKRSELLGEEKLPSKPQAVVVERDFTKLPDIMKSRFVFAKDNMETINSTTTPMTPGLYESKPVKKEEIIKKHTKRVVFEWYPERIVSKRFDIPHPNPEINFIGTKRNSVISKPRVYDNVGIGADIDIFSRLEQKEEEESTPQEKELIRPSMEIFKEIFEPKKQDEQLPSIMEMKKEEEEEEEEGDIPQEEEEKEEDIFSMKPKLQTSSITTPKNFTSTHERITEQSDFLRNEEEEKEVEFKPPIYVPQKKIEKKKEKSYKELKKN